MRWLVDEWHWPKAAAFAALFLLAVAPLVFDATSAAFGLVYLQLPLYMLHQLEEHGHDQFRRFVNERMAAGREALTRPATFFINSVGVWGVNLAAIWLAWYADLAFGLIAIYITAVNALIHIAGAIALRGYNPGLYTAIVLFVPAAVWGAIEVNEAADAGAGYQALAIGLAVGIHAAIVIYLRGRLERLDRRSTARFDRRTEP